MHSTKTRGERNQHQGPDGTIVVVQIPPLPLQLVRRSYRRGISQRIGRELEEAEDEPQAAEASFVAGMKRWRAGSIL